MSEQPVFESPVANPRSQSHRNATLTDESSTTKLIVRADHGTPAAEFLNLAYGSSRSQGDALIIGQRPTEWLIVGSPSAVETVSEKINKTGHVSLIDHTHSRAMFRLTGNEAENVLAKLCNADLSDSMTPDRAALSASIAMVNCDIVRDDLAATRSYRIACDRSFAQFLYDAILDACDEFWLLDSSSDSA